MKTIKVLTPDQIVALWRLLRPIIFLNKNMSFSFLEGVYKRWEEDATIERNKLLEKYKNVDVLVYKEEE